MNHEGLADKISSQCTVDMPSEADGFLPKDGHHQTIAPASSKQNQFLLYIIIIGVFLLIVICLVDLFYSKNPEILEEETHEREQSYEALVSLNKTIEDFAILKVENKIWHCGGISKNINQSQVCTVLNLNDGKSKPF